MVLNAYAAVYLAAAVVILGVAVAVWSRRTTPGGSFFLLMLLGLVIWSGAYGLELASDSLETMRQLVRIQYLGIATLSPLWLAFVFAFTGRPPLSRAAWAALLAVPATTILLVLTNDLHHLYYAASVLDATGAFPLQRLSPGPWYAIQIAFSFVIMSAGASHLVGHAWYSPAPLRRQVLIIASAAMIPAIALILYIVGVRPLGTIDLTPLGFALAGTVTGLALFRHRFLDLVPVAAPAVVDRIPIGVVVVDRIDRVVGMNPAAARILSCHPDAAIGRPIHEIAGGWDELRAAFARGPSTGPVEVRRRHDDEPDEHFEVDLASLAETGGRAVLVRDVTVRVRALSALRESEAFTRGLVENLPDLVVVYDDDRRILYVNPAVERTLGVPAGTLIGARTSDHVAPGWLGLIDRMGELRRGGEEIPPYEIGLLTPDGRPLTVFARVVPVPFRDRPAYLALLNDVTEQKELEAALQRRTAELEEVSKAALRANGTLGLLNALTRHDIGNQLVAIRGHLELASEFAEGSELRDRLARTQASVGRVEAMVRFMGEYGALGTSAPLWQDLAGLVRAAAAGLPLEGVTLEVRTAGTEVLADPLIERALYTFLENAVRHGGPGLSRIVLDARTEGDLLLVTVEDDGVGVPEDQKERIFERGYGRNTGLGLFLAQEVLAITGIGLAETGVPGRGARFELRVPRESWRPAG